MKKEHLVSVLGTGVYRVSDASRLINVSTSTIRRWLRGYKYSSGGKTLHSPAKWSPQHADPELKLGFLDLMEARIIGFFRAHGLKWSTIEAAAERARVKYKTLFPFATLRLQTDGVDAFLPSAESNDAALVSIVSSQNHFTRVLKPYLVNVDYEDSMAVRWWPKGRDSEVVLDPKRSFGKPIVESSGIPTYALAGAFKAEKAIEPVARWFQVSEKAVKDAIAFEDSLAA